MVNDAKTQESEPDNHGGIAGWENEYESEVTDPDDDRLNDKTTESAARNDARKQRIISLVSVFILFSLFVWSLSHDASHKLTGSDKALDGLRGPVKTVTYSPAGNPKSIFINELGADPAARPLIKIDSIVFHYDEFGARTKELYYDSDRRLLMQLEYQSGRPGESSPKDHSWFQPMHESDVTDSKYVVNFSRNETKDKYGNWISRTYVLKQSFQFLTKELWKEMRHIE